MTADPWSLLRHLLVKRLGQDRERAALAHLEQGREFFEAAANSRTRSKPLLYYYSFLNLAKMALVHEKVPIPPVVKHGISDPKANVRKKVRLEGQRVRIQGLAPGHSELFPEFVALLGGNAQSNRDVRVVDLLRQIPSIHRTYCHVADCEPAVAPIHEVSVLRDRGVIWARLGLQRGDADVQKALPAVRRRRVFQEHLRQVAPPKGAADEKIWLETEPVPARTSGTDAAIRQLAARLQDVGVATILTSTGYRSYLSSIEPRQRVPPLAAPYAAMFYLGSITRYKPYDYDAIVKGGYSWLVGELIATQPTQFLYGLASWLAGVDVVRPYAAV